MIFTDFNSINIPYIFVLNHESPAAIAALKAIENIAVLEVAVEVAVIKVAGIAIPLLPAFHERHR